MPLFRTLNHTKCISLMIQLSFLKFCIMNWGQINSVEGLNQSNKKYIEWFLYARHVQDARNSTLNKTVLVLLEKIRIGKAQKKSLRKINIIKMVSAMIDYYRIQVKSVRTMPNQNLNDRFPQRKVIYDERCKKLYSSMGIGDEGADPAIGISMWKNPRINESKTC